MIFFHRFLQRTALEASGPCTTGSGCQWQESSRTGAVRTYDFFLFLFWFVIFLFQPPNPDHDPHPNPYPNTNPTLLNTYARGVYFGMYDSLSGINPMRHEKGALGLASKFGIAQVRILCDLTYTGTFQQLILHVFYSFLSFLHSFHSFLSVHSHRPPPSLPAMRPTPSTPFEGGSRCSQRSLRYNDSTAHMIVRLRRQQR